MIKNVIFDVGKVLVDFCWEKVFRELGLEGEAFEAVADATVHAEVWKEFDRGLMSEEEILTAFIREAPQYEKEIRGCFAQVGRMIEQYAYSTDWIRSLTDKGYHTYILSNFPKKIYEEGQNNLTFVKEVSGAVFSYTVGCVKPEKKIYRILMERYNLNPAECVFIDDREENLIAPHAFGIETIQFESYEQARAKLMKFGIK